MRSGHRSDLLIALTVLTSGAVFSACAGGGGGGGGGSSFQISAVNLTDGAVWKINRQIRISFNQPVDFSSVTLNSINVRRVGGGPAAGEFFIDSADPNTVVFQPLCPTLDDLSDAGLLAGGDPNNNNLPYAYELNVLGVDMASQLPVRSTGGVALATSDTRLFTTPTSTNALDLYIDTKVGPPVARVIDAASVGGPPLGENDADNSTYIEVKEDPTTLQPKRYYFQRVSGQIVLADLDAGTAAPDLPLNKLSDPASQIALYIGFDQAVDPSTANINDTRIRWEFEAGAGNWVALPVTVSLEANCTRDGARVKVVPLGLLPPSTRMRAVITPQFVDIVGENNLLTNSNFAVADTEIFPITPPELMDNYLEDFDTAANDDESFLFSEPHALWGDGDLTATFSFSGTGGPGGDFDWVVPTGTTILFNTSISTISGYQIFEDPNTGAFTGYQGPLSNQTAVGGFVDVDDIWVQAGAVVKFEGPNPVTILAAGTVRIDGSISIVGTSTNGVGSLNTTNIPEPGAPGQAGGGKGGTGSPLTTASSPGGTAGFGAFNVSDGGGRGGETGWSLTADVNKRRGAGGGGGRLGKDVPNPTTGTGQFDQRQIGLDAEKGFDVVAGDNGAVTGAPGPFGGAAGPGPFVDPDANNDFFGTMYVVDNDPTTPGNQSVLRRGELIKPWAGAGGGGGGDASRVTTGTFPGPWSPTGDEKGSGGGGGGGSFQMLALGDIVFGASGEVRCRGGLGGGGENTSFLNRVGGGSGGGSGGHVVLQTATQIDFRLCDLSPRPILATGGQGGAGSNDLGGAIQSTNGQKETLPNQDACPTGYATTGVNPCKGQVDGAGGDGGPGIIQLHTTTGTVGLNPATGADILLPGPVGGQQLTLRDLCQPPALCPGGATGNGTIPADCFMIPTFGRKSRAVSKWIALGQGGFDVANPGTYRDVTFDFAGIDPVTGLVQTTSGVVQGLAPVMPAVTVPQSQITDDYTLVLSAAPLAGTSLVANTRLLEHYLLQLADASDPTDFARFDVVAASYNATAQTLTLTVDADGPKLNEAVTTWANVSIELQPAYFRVRSSGISDSLPSTATVQIQFEATTANAATGNPVEPPTIGPTSDPAVLSATPNSQLRFVRFQVLFDIANGVSLAPTNAVPSLEFVRLPFRYQ